MSFLQGPIDHPDWSFVAAARQGLSNEIVPRIDKER